MRKPRGPPLIAGNAHRCADCAQTNLLENLYVNLYNRGVRTRAACRQRINQHKRQDSD